jgi:hypothetical protein
MTIVSATRVRCLLAKESPSRCSRQRAAEKTSKIRFLAWIEAALTAAESAVLNAE